MSFPDSIALNFHVFASCRQITEKRRLIGSDMLTAHLTGETGCLTLLRQVVSPSDGLAMRDHQPVTEAELSVLEFLWNAGPSTKRDMADSLYPAGRDADIATVHKLLQRLEAKGYVTRDRSSIAHVFSATLPKNEFVGRQLASVAEKLSGGSLAPLVMHLVEGRRLTKRERAKLRALLDEGT